MGRVYSENVSDSSDLKEGQEVICRVIDIHSSDDWIEYEPILSGGGNFVDPHSDHYPFEPGDVSHGDYLIFEYSGGTAFKFVEIEKA